MSLLRTLAFAVFLLLITSGSVYLLHTQLGLKIHHAAGALVFPYITLVLGYHKYQENKNSADTANDDRPETTSGDDETADPHSDVGYQTKPAPLGGTSDDTPPDAEQTTDDEPSDPDQDRSGPAGRLDESSLLRSKDKIIEEAEEKLNGTITIHDDGTFEITADDLHLYSEMMLHVIGQRLAYEYQAADTPEMTVEELRTEIGDKSTDHNNIEVLLFLEAAGSYLSPVYRASDIDYRELDELTFAATVKQLSEAVDWALEDDWGYPNLHTDLQLAASALDDARSQYQDVAEKEDVEFYTVSQADYDPVVEEVLRACSNLSQYPLETEYDYNWEQFTKTVDAMLYHLGRKSPNKIPYCLKRMGQSLGNMRETVRKQQDW